jgi:integrase
VENHPSLHYSEMPAFMQTLRRYQADYIAATALEIVILTALRPNKEARLLRWEEIDWIGKFLKVPAERMKKRKDRKEAFFYVPLSDRAVALLRQLEARQLEAGAKGLYVFSVRSPNKPMAEGTMIKFLRNTMGIPVEDGFDVHGFRSSFRVWGKKNKFDYEALEMCLDHVVGSQTVRAYNRDDLFDERREIMTTWAEFCEGR